MKIVASKSAPFCILCVVFCGLALFAQTQRANASDILANLPNHVFLDLIPGAATDTSPRSAGFGFSWERLNDRNHTFGGMGSEVLFPMFQQGRTAHIDWNTSFTLLAPLSETHWLGGKVGVMINRPENQIMYVALAFRAIPAGAHDWFTFQWVTKQIEVGTHSRGKLYAALRFGFSLF